MLYLYETGEPIESSRVKMIFANVSHSKAAAVCIWKTTEEQTIYLVYSELQRGVHPERKIKAHYTQAERAEKFGRETAGDDERRGFKLLGLAFENISNMCFNVQGINR